MNKPKRKIKAFYVVTGITAEAEMRRLAEFSHKGQILKGLRKQGLDFEKYQSITIHKQPITVYEYARKPKTNHYIPKLTK
ncbi:hypothetical protein ACWIW6_02760 [Ursidibacter sp. B-7004-1]|uniref:hypothetical protein n=1 Tax=Ursidibacter arcticus TaxID=1524965 RepID=UPI0012FB2718|nr:hypothetical protein [Ursidibacter arcticus]KAE9536043.1 hypothetical protein A1D25_04245 [Ursidibacter arcticus]